MSSRRFASPGGISWNFSYGTQQGKICSCSGIARDGSLSFTRNGLATKPRCIGLQVDGVCGMSGFFTKRLSKDEVSSFVPFHNDKMIYHWGCFGLVLARERAGPPPAGEKIQCSVGLQDLQVWALARIDSVEHVFRDVPCFVLTKWWPPGWKEPTLQRPSSANIPAAYEETWHPVVEFRKGNRIQTPA